MQPNKPAHAEVTPRSCKHMAYSNCADRDYRKITCPFCGLLMCAGCGAVANAEATPRPWRNERGSGDYGRNITANSGRRIVCETICAEHDANAALIVEAVNAHEAAIALAALIERSTAWRIPPEDVWDSIINLARAFEAARKGEA